jgi:folate-dependent phosphoribosylglycinamide formyltransferase PurN
MALRLAILCSDDVHHVFLQARLAVEFDVRLVLVEPASAQRHALLARHRYCDYLAHIYHFWRRRLCGLDAYRRGYFALPPEAHLPADVRRTLASINHESVPRLLQEAAPDVVVVMGTSILRRAVLEAAADAAILNIHGGYLPDYRGNHCFFWALYDGRPDRIGSTIHFVDPGIDTGDVLEVVPVTVTADDTAETLYCRAEHEAISHLVHCLHLLEAGQQLPRVPQMRTGRAHRVRDRKPWHDLALWVRRRWEKRQIEADGSNDDHNLPTPLLPY